MVSRLLSTCVIVAMGCASREPPVQAVELPSQQPAVVATVSVALPQNVPPPPPKRTGWQPPTPRPENMAEARKRFMLGIRAFDAGRYQEALTELETAYAYKAVDPVLYNIAVVLEKLGRVDEAIDVYERYVTTDAAKSRRSEVQQKIDTLRHQRP